MIIYPSEAVIATITPSAPETVNMGNVTEKLTSNFYGQFFAIFKHIDIPWFYYVPQLLILFGFLFFWFWYKFLR